jgi:hypothetical protein
MKEDVYPGDIERIPVKLLPPKKQQPFIKLAKERHALVTDLAALGRAGYRVREPVSVPFRRVLARFWDEHPKAGRVNLLVGAARDLFEVEPAWRDRDLRRAVAAGDAVKVGRDVAIRPGSGIKDRERVARILALLAAALPGTWADGEATEMVPDSEKASSRWPTSWTGRRSL